MDIEKLYKILSETTVQLRKGDVLEGTPETVGAIKAGKKPDEIPGGVVEFYGMPHENEATPEIEKVDLEFIVVGVDKAKAQEKKAELVALLDAYPDPEQLASGPSYIAVGGTIGDQGAAFQLFALGKVLGLWDVITPKMLGAEGEQARQMAGAGYIVITGYKPAAKAA